MPAYRMVVAFAALGVILAIDPWVFVDILAQILEAIRAILKAFQT